MDQLSAGNVATWCVSGLTLGCIVTFASVKYEDFIRRRRRKLEKAIVKFILPPSSEPKQSVAPTFTIRGYDSDELFREDLWLRRIAHSRSQIAEIQTSMSGSKTIVPTREDDRNRVCAMLARHATARCDN
jgi:hypothetical protein